jgi:DNA invertase Pin-like site-specific DNA recombinase
MKDNSDARTHDMHGGIRIGYARVSTDDQLLNLQIDALKAAGCVQIYEEQASGKQADRPELAHALKALRKGDTLVVWRLDRLGRSLPHLVESVTAIEALGASFESLTEKIETGSATGRLVFHLFAALAEFERNLISERTKEGLKAARKRGHRGGRKPALDAKAAEQVKLLMKDRSIRPTDLAKTFGVSRTTIYKMAKEAA